MLVAGREGEGLPASPGRSSTPNYATEGTSSIEHLAEASPGLAHDHCQGPYQVHFPYSLTHVAHSVTQNVPMLHDIQLVSLHKEFNSWAKAIATGGGRLVSVAPSYLCPPTAAINLER